MKKILFLLFAPCFVYAATITDLEHAIMKSDLTAVETILNGGITVSMQEHVALINLASEITKKRENKIFTHEMVLINNKESNLKYLKQNKELQTLREKAGKPLLVFGGFLACCIASLTALPSLCALLEEFASYGSLMHSVANRLLVASLAAGAISLIAMKMSLLVLLVKCAKINELEKTVIEQRKCRYKALYNAAIQIKQCIFMIKVV